MKTKQDIHCDKCGKYLFTENESEIGYKRENDNGGYTYDELAGEFICDKCFIKFSLEHPRL